MSFILTKVKYEFYFYESFYFFWVFFYGGKRFSIFRMAVTYADLRAQWMAAPATFDAEGTSLRILDEPVMQSWELPYMTALAAAACRTPMGHVLEVGYGMGLSADAHDVASHTIIEANIDVAQRAMKWAETSLRPTTVLVGFWQDVTGSLIDGAYDGILFDVYPLTLAEVIDGEQSSFFATAARLLRSGGVFTFYYDVVDSWYATRKLFRAETTPLLLSVGFRSVDGDEVVEVQPPPDCAYFWKNMFLVPVAVK